MISKVKKIDFKANSNVFWFLFAFVLMFVIMYNAPMISDDFEFTKLSLSSFGEMWRYCLTYGNGRLLGNLGVLVVINSTFLKAFVKAVTVAILVLMLPFVLKVNRTIMLPISFLLVFGCSPIIFAQIFTWTSGFQNYVPPILLTLLCFGIISRCETKSIARTMLLIVIGVCGQLYVEHSTILNILIPIAMFVFYRVENNKEKQHLAKVWFFSAIAGAVLMVLIPKIFYVQANRAEGYRQTGFSSLGKLTSYIIEGVKLSLITYARCAVLWVLFAICGLLILRCIKLHNKVIEMAIRCLYICLIVVSVLCGVLFELNDKIVVVKILQYMMFLQIPLCFVCTAIIVWKLPNKKIKLFLSSCLAFAIISVAPFLLVRPFGERCVFLSYMFLGVFSIKGIDYGMEILDLHPGRKWIGGLCGLLLVLSVFLIFSFNQAVYYDGIRNAYIEERMAAKEKKIVIFEIPSHYTFATMLIEEYYFYERPRDIEFEIVAYSQWCQEHTLDGGKVSGK